ncbi:MAG: thermonuclease family protein, partial [Pseudonocardia sp.]
ALVVAGTTTAVVAGVSKASGADRAVVTRIVDGDTIDVEIDDRVERVRLLNIDTPETVDPDEDVQCLGPEAAAHLAELIPVGSTVDLEYDEARLDGYGRTLAGVFTDGGLLVNAEMARAGLAMPVVVGGNDRFAPEVRAANAEAAAAARGLYSPQIDCTVPAQVDNVVAALRSMPTASSLSADATATQLAEAATAALAVKAVAQRLTARLAGTPKGVIWSVLDDSRRTGLRTQLAGVQNVAEHEATGLSRAAAAKRSAAAVSPEPEPKPKPKPKASTPTTPKPKAAATPKPTPQPETTSKPEAKSQGSGGNPYPGYTGPRCYAPGGKTWKPC